MKQEITQELVKDLFDYRDGELFWKVNKAWQIQIDDKVGSLKNNGYYQIGINGKQYYNHRLIYLYHYGYIPKQIDHIDNDSTNNKIENLRESNQSQNMMNREPNKNTLSIYKGVSWHKRHNKWISRININHKVKHLGYFINEIDAAIAYNDAAIELFKKFANLNEVYNNKICNNCKRIIPEKSNYIEYTNNIVFCNENCENLWNQV